MNKLLLSLGLAAMTGMSAQAVTLSVNDAKDIVGEFTESTYNYWNNVSSFAIGDYKFGLTSAEGATPNALYDSASGEWTMRVYIGATFTISAPAGEPMSSIEMVCTQTKGLTESNMMTASEGTVVLDGKTLKWTPSQADVEVYDVTFYVPNEKGDGANPNIRITTFKIDENGGDTPTPDDPVVDGSVFTLTTSLTSGDKYVIVADGHIAQPIQPSFTYGYLKIGECSVNGNMVTAAEALAFTFIQNGADWNIQQPDGRYLLQKGDYNSYNLTNAVDESCLFEVTFNADNSAVIRNISVDKSMQYDSGYNSYGSYPDVRGTFPCIYGLAPDQIEEVAGATDSQAVYFGMDGMRVVGEPACGLYIKIQDGKAWKVVVK